ncbi:MAG TPA: hypothetical protein VGJ28_25255 [Micromonosporaceae bacterium]|jgi:hypothetical protein
MRSSNDDVDIGRFFAWAARPRETPGRHEELHRIVARYLDEPDFAAAVDRVFSGAGLDVQVDERDGIIVTARAHSFLRLHVTDIMKRAQPHHRAVIGAVILAVARTAYPEAGMVDDPDRIAVFTTQSVVDTLDRAAQRLADASIQDSDIDEDLVEGWRRWLDLTQARPYAQRRSTGDRPGAVNRICKMLTEAGYLTARGETDGGTWTVRPRFRYAVAALAEDSDLYALVNDLPAPIDIDRVDPT